MATKAPVSKTIATLNKTTPVGGGTVDAKRPELYSEVANRSRDPFETLFQGVIRTNDPLLLERGTHGNPWQIYRDLKRDGKIFSCLQKRKMALISCPVRVEPVTAGKQGQIDADIVLSMLKMLNYDQVCDDELDAIILGFVVSEVIWGERDGYIVPLRIVKRAQRRFVYVQTDPNAAPELRLLTAQNMLTGEPLPDNKFIVHRVNPEDDNPYGNGLGLQLYWAKWFKDKGILSWNKLNERLGSPIPWGKHPNKATPGEKSTFFEALKAMMNDGTLMTPEGMQIEMIESKLTGSVTTHERICAYMDAWIQEVILSQEPGGTTGATAGAANERQDVRLDIVKGDADLLNDTHNSTLIDWICHYNGLSPCRVSREIQTPEDLLAASQTDVNIHSLGFKPSLDYIRSRYGEGWEQAPLPVAPSPTAPAPVGSGQPTSFAEPNPVSSATSPIALNMAKVGDSILVDWMLKIADLVKTAPTAEALRDQLLQAYGGLPSEQLQELMALAFAAAELTGMDAVATETAQDI
jgi:phage gp29-like protein